MDYDKIRSFFEQVGTIQLLLLLAKSEKEQFNQQLVDKGIHQMTIKKARMVLEEFGLIEIFTKKNDPYRRLYYLLTEKGKKTVEQLQQLIIILLEEC